MTIKQQGGVFGRNPTFNDVTVDGTLSTGGALSTGGIISTTSNILIEAGSPNIRFAETDTTDQNYRIRAQAGQFIFEKIADDNSIVTECFRVDSSNNLDLKTGSLAVANGQGIDFSATAGTGTSELFSDYEQGTWTPTYEASTTNPTFSSYGLQTGYYTKVGELVYVSARIRTNGYNSDGAGNLRIGGLPYASASIATIGSGGAISILASVSFTSNPAAGYFISGGNYIELNSNTLFTAATVSALNTGTSHNDISFFGVYRAS